MAIGEQSCYSQDLGANLPRPFLNRNRSQSCASPIAFVILIPTNTAKVTCQMKYRTALALLLLPGTKDIARSDIIPTKSQALLHAAI
ncbi:MAG: hypothetical protein KIT69_00810 [Propionibacteriaceae bacterium]|nr:hypothetical protein [Propionibacteriaceae bacterium]